MANCNGCLKKDTDGFCSACEKNLFDRSKVPSTLTFNWGDIQDKIEGQPQVFSVSGMQPKGFVGRDKNKLLTPNRHLESMYIIKPPLDSRKTRFADSPANEHLTMSVAHEVFGILTARCAFMTFENGEPAYLTRRFDRTKDGEKLRQEDFLSVLGIQSQHQNSGMLKYTSASYEDVGNMLFPADQMKLLKILLFNYISGNGDVHLKNISLRESPQGDMLLSPAYDLMNTKLHINDPVIAMNLFVESERGKDLRHAYDYKAKDFIALGQRWGLKDKQIDIIVNEIESGQNAYHKLIGRSFLTDPAKNRYAEIVERNYKQLFR